MHKVGANSLPGMLMVEAYKKCVSQEFNNDQLALGITVT